MDLCTSLFAEMKISDFELVISSKHMPRTRVNSEKADLLILDMSNKFLLKKYKSNLT